MVETLTTKAQSDTKGTGIASESGHYYFPDGRPCYTITGKNGFRASDHKEVLKVRAQLRAAQRDALMATIKEVNAQLFRTIQYSTARDWKQSLHEIRKDLTAVIYTNSLNGNQSNQ